MGSFLVSLLLCYCAVAKVVPLGGWRLMSSANVSVGFSATSLSNYNDHGWIKTSSFASVLGNLINDAGKFVNVFFGFNLKDIDQALFMVPWIYRTTFRTTSSVGTVRFKGIS
jgi:hypothetical protein